MSEAAGKTRIDQSVWLPRKDAEDLATARHGNPFSVLGIHDTAGGPVLRVYVPGALGVDVFDRQTEMLRCSLTSIQIPGLFAGLLPHAAPYRLRIRWPDGVTQETEDPYSFGPLLGDLDLYLIGEGTHREIGHCLGAQPTVVEGIEGVRFAVWAPNARRVSVVGDFNHWDGRRHPMRKR
ncbi:MAG: GlgB N-terminal domain-containing protein, partial [Marinobacter sp.]